MSCHGLNCTNTKLVKAHIVPAGFGRLIRSGQGPLLKLATDRVAEAVPQLGDYDTNILCETCDNILGKDDEYALTVCKTFKAKSEKENGDYFELEGIDCERFSKFVLSVIWRASISTRGAFCAVRSLGPYNKIAREIIFGIRPIEDFPQFELVISRFRNRGDDVNGINIYPVRFTFDGLNAYSLVLSGFRIPAKLDKQMLKPEFEKLIINRTKVFRGLFLE